MSPIDKIPLVRVAEVAFLTTDLSGCIEFYRNIGLGEFSPDPDKKKIHFANVGEQYFGFADDMRGFFSGYNDEMIKAQLHVAFEIPGDKIDDCISFLASKGIKCSPRIENSEGWHGVRKSSSTYFRDPQGNIMELWAPNRG